MEYTQLEYMITCTTAKGMWDKLSTLHEQKSESNKLTLMTKFHEYRMMSSDTVAQHIAKVENMARHLKDIGEEISQVTIMAKILGTLPSKFNPFVTAWDNIDSEKQTLDNLTLRLVKEENRLTVTDEMTRALSATSINTAHGQSRGTNKAAGQNKQPQKNQNQQKKKIECFYCHKLGHIEKFCRKKKKDSQENQKRDNDSTDVNAFMVEVSSPPELLKKDTKDIWLLDSGASKHMTHHRSWFSEFTSHKNETVLLGDEGILDVEGCGSILIERYVNGEWIKGKLENVLYVPSLKKNLLSVGACTNKNYIALFKKNSVELYLNKKLMASGILQRNNLFRMLFRVVGQSIEAEANVHETGSLKLWHERLGHVGLNTIREMHKNNLVKGLNISKDEDFMCESCQYGKQHRLPFKKERESRQVRIGEFIHSDLVGPMQESSLGGAKFFVVFKDDCSGFRCVYFLKHKYDTFERFKEFEASVKNKFQTTIKTLRTDNGTEYCNQAMLNYLTSQGIQLETTAPHTPQQNGRSERDNRTIMESAWTMLHASGLSKRLWAEAVNTAVYTLNRTATTQVKDSTPYELWTGKKPDLSHMKIFGAAAFVHIPDQLRRKLDAKSKKMFLVGYQRESTNYRLYDPVGQKITVSRDVNFKEILNNNNDSLLQKTDDIPVSISRENISEEEQTIPENEVLLNDGHEDELPGTIAGSGEQQHNLRDRSKIQKPARYDVNLVEYQEPKTFEEAINGNNSDKWRTAIKEELEAHEANGTWILTKLPEKKKTISSTWVFKVKYFSSEDSVHFKARLCAKGCQQVAGIDYQETFAPVVRYDSVRMLLAIAAQRDLEIAQFDVKTAFLHGELDEEIYMDIPKGVVAQKNTVCKLKKSLYGLKQSPRCWNKKFDSFLKQFKFVNCTSDPCVYRSKSSAGEIFLALYVDDGLILATTQEILNDVINELKSKFSITENKSDSFVGLQIKRIRKKKQIFIHQQTYIECILRRFEMYDAKPVSTPADPHVTLTLTRDNNTSDKSNSKNYPFKEVIGSLIFLAIVSRSDIIFAVSYLSRFLSGFDNEHWSAVKRVLRYLKGTSSLGITYQYNENNFALLGYSDADYAADLDTRRSTTGYLFCLSGGPITWNSQRQKTVSLSTTEAEYKAACAAAKEMIWLKRFLLELSCTDVTYSCICIDNQSTIKLVKNPTLHKRTKHIDIKYHFIREQYANKEIDIRYVPSVEQLADIFTKPLPKDRFVTLCNKIGITEALK